MRGSRTRRVGVAAIACAVVAGLVLPAGGAAARQTVLARVNADADSATRRIPKSFLGVSVEVDQARKFVAVPGQKVAARVWLQMMRNLAAFGGGMPVFRIGGGTGDKYYFYNGARSPKPRGATFKIDYRYLAGVRAYLEASGAPLMFPINFAANDPELAKQMAQLVLSYMPPGSVKAFEVGNEPDIYDQLPLTPTETIRPKEYTPAKYLRELTNYKVALSQVSPAPILGGPGSVAQYGEWNRAFPKIVRKFDLVTIHNYAVFACGKKVGTFRKVSPYELLRPKALEHIFPVLAKASRTARKEHRLVRLTETNSVACGGAKGVSDAFASALWATDWMFAVAAAGLEGLNFHMGSTRYTPFIPFRPRGQGQSAQVRPLYYAMLLFAEATAHRARLLKSTFYAGQARKGTLHVWGTYDSVDHVVRVVINNKSGRRGGYVLVHVPHATGNGSLKRLSARSVSSTEVTWGGQKFANPTPDGLLVGSRQVSVSHRRKGSKFRVKMPKAGVALLTVPVRRR